MRVTGGTCIGSSCGGVSDVWDAGEGSFGRVYKARRRHTGAAMRAGWTQRKRWGADDARTHARAGHIVAMKVISKKGKSEKDVDSLRKELEIMRPLRHENIILMLDSFENAREFCVVTEFGQVWAAAAMAGSVRGVDCTLRTLGNTIARWGGHAATSAPSQGELFQILEDDRTLPEAEVQKIARQLVLVGARRAPGGHCRDAPGLRAAAAPAGGGIGRLLLGARRCTICTTTTSCTAT